MKRHLFLLIIFIIVILFQAVAVQADKDQAVFAIQKARSFIEKVKAKSEETKTPVETLRSAQEFLQQAEAKLKANTSMLGKLKKEAEPEVLYYADMAEISASIVLSRLEKVNQDKENTRLEKLIPETEAKIKVFLDKDAEIQRLTEEVRKPKGSLQTLSSEIAFLKKEKTDLTEQASQLKLERENLIGRQETLTTENLRLRNELKALETQKGSDIVDMRSRLQVATRTVEFDKALGKLGYWAKVSDKVAIYIIPRKEMIKTTPKGPALVPGAETHITRFADLTNAFPESKLKIDVHGFGNPVKNEDKKATDAMANLLKEAFIKGGIKESSFEINGAGSGSPQFSKGAVEENRRIEISVYR
jgi:hypothetical protein